jgi:uncharacterized pyridoxamine 5'-phosphate oxidase family protein
MNEVLDFLNEAKVFFLATVEGDQPRVRPFGFAMEYDGKLCYCTSNQKPVYAQLKANPKAEISASTSDGRWLRISGSVVFCSTREAKTKALEIMPSLRAMYSEEDSIFEIFYLGDADASIHSFRGESKTIKL